MQVYAQLFEKEIKIKGLTHNSTYKKPLNTLKTDTKTHITAKLEQKHPIKPFSNTFSSHPKAKNKY